jgi:glycolate oxidase FAD binding subunit
VRAGTTSGQLAAVLEAAKQRLPVDVACAERATVGGMIATGDSGPLRLGHGTLRDYLLGVQVIGADGRLVRAGGRVVKNVAGYDLMKLHTGARGTLGVVVGATFKVKPIPDRQSWVVAGAIAPVMAERLRLALAAAQVPAVALELLSPAIASDTEVARAASAPWIVAVGIEGVDVEVRWQEERVIEVLAAAGAPAPAVVDGSAARDFLRKIADFGAADDSDLMVKGAVLPSRLPELVESWIALAPRATVAASAGSGVARLGTVGATPATVTALRRAAVVLGGYAVVERMPDSFQGEVDPWGTTALPLAARLKAALDPGSVFLPGSYLGLGAASPAAVAG